MISSLCPSHSRTGLKGLFSNPSLHIIRPTTVIRHVDLHAQRFEKRTLRTHNEMHSPPRDERGLAAGGRSYNVGRNRRLL